MEVSFKQKFLDRYSQLTDIVKFKDYSLRYLRRSIRVNTLKMSVHDLVKRLKDKWNLKPIPWCKEGFWIEHKKKERRDIGNLEEHVLGYFYTQEAVSMIPPIVLSPKPGELVLDMCAAPGSKATQISAMMKNQGLLIANDFKGMRLAPLGINLQRMGVKNSIITLMEGRFFNLEFDKILVDAPCSGTGTIRKSFKTLRIWNPNMVKRLAAIQKQLIQTAFKCLKPGGVMVYSTCTLEPEEDELVVSYLLEKNQNAKIEPINLNIKRSPAVTQFEGQSYKQVEDCLRMWPQDNDTEGFFVAKIRKMGNDKTQGTK